MECETVPSWNETFQLVPHRLGDDSWDFSVTENRLRIYLLEASGFWVFRPTTSNILNLQKLSPSLEPLPPHP